MQKKNWILISCIAIFLVAGLLALRSASAAPPENSAEKSTCCKKTSPSCTEKSNSPVETPPESLSRQFIFITNPVY